MDPCRTYPCQNANHLSYDALSGFPSMRDSYYYVLANYTTLGEGNISLPDRWRS